MAEENNASFPFLAILGLIFITLKLLGKIEWSWWWVTLPLWGPPVLLVVVALAALVVGAVVWVIVWAWENR